MSSKTVLITGATGFVGSRLAERLALGTDYGVKALVRRFSGPGLARLARMPVEFVLADLLDPDALTTAAQGCDAVVHCAYGNKGNNEQRKAITVTGTENVLQAALRAGARKVIHLSSSVVHGRDPGVPMVDESAPLKNDGDPYSASKIEAEETVWRYHREHGLPAVIFRPTLIYGPYGRMWTVRPIQELKAGAILINGGSGASSPIYVDNLIDAILLALETDAGDGEAFILADDEALTWRDVYERYAAMLASHPPLLELTVAEIEALRQAGQTTALRKWVLSPALMVPAMVKYSLRSPDIRSQIRAIPWSKYVKKLIPQDVKNRLKGENGVSAPDAHQRAGPVVFPDPGLVELCTSQSRFSTAKAQRLLGYTQRISFDQAMELTRAWLTYQQLIP